MIKFVTIPLVIRLRALFDFSEMGWDEMTNDMKLVFKFSSCRELNSKCRSMKAYKLNFHMLMFSFIWLYSSLEMAFSFYK